MKTYCPGCDPKNDGPLGSYHPNHHDPEQIRTVGFETYCVCDYCVNRLLDKEELAANLRNRF